MTSWLTCALLTGILTLVAWLIRITTHVYTELILLRQSTAASRQSLGHLYDVLTRIESALRQPRPPHGPPA